MKEDAIRAGIKEQTQILRSLKEDKKKGHKVDYLIDQTEGQLIALQSQIPRGHVLTFLPFLLLNAALGGFLVSSHFVPAVREFIAEGFAGRGLVALIEVKHYPYVSAGGLALQRKLHMRHAAVGNVVAVLLEIAVIVVLTSPWIHIQRLISH
ncbi:MAG: hypothetical protein ACYS47_10720 [Planctomycetota bacterium]|jgi:hypothetical protein